MRRIVASLLFAAVLGDGYWVSTRLVPHASGWFDGDEDLLNLSPDFIPDWHFKAPRFHAPCLGLCPDLENRP